MSIGISAEGIYQDSLSGDVPLRAGTFGSIVTKGDVFGSKVSSEKIITNLPVLAHDGENLDIASHTVAFWIKPTATISGRLIYTICSSHNGDDEIDQYSLYQTSTNKLQLHFENGHKMITSKVTLQNYQWTHVAVTISKTPNKRAAMGSIFVNGNRDVISSPGYFPIGVNGLKSPNYTKFSSGLTLAGIYLDSNVLTASEIQVKAVESFNSSKVSPSALFKMNELSGTNMVDEFGEISGTYVGKPNLGVKSVNEENKTAVEFDGDSRNYAVINSAEKISNGPFSVAFWAKGDHADDYEAIVSCRNKSNGWIFYYYEGFAQFWVSTGETEWTYEVKATVDSKWHHYVGTFDGHTASLYVDGICKRKEVVTDYRELEKDAVIHIGRNPESGSEFPFKGSIDELQFYKKCLSKSEVKTIFSSMVDETGLKFSQSDGELQWTVESEHGIKSYQIVDVLTGEIIEFFLPTGESVYKTMIPQGVKASVIVDKL